MPLEEEISSLKEAVATLTKIITKQTEILSKGGSAGGSSSSTSSASTEDKVISVDDIKKAFGSWMDATEDDDEKARRRKIMVAISKNFSVERPSEIPEGERANALKLLNNYKKEDFKDVLKVFVKKQSDDL